MAIIRSGYSNYRRPSGRGYAKARTLVLAVARIQRRRVLLLRPAGDSRRPVRSAPHRAHRGWRQRRRPHQHRRRASLLQPPRRSPPPVTTADHIDDPWVGGRGANVIPNAP